MPSILELDSVIYILLVVCGFTLVAILSKNLARVYCPSMIGSIAFDSVSF